MVEIVSLQVCVIFYRVHDSKLCQFIAEMSIAAQLHVVMCPKTRGAAAVSCAREKQMSLLFFGVHLRLRSPAVS